MAVAAVGVSVAGATPQTQFNKGEFKLILVRSLKAKLDAWMLTKWNFDGAVTYGFTDKTAFNINIMV